MRRGVETISVVGGLVLVLVIVVIILVALSDRFALLKKAESCAQQGGACTDGLQCPDTAPYKLLTLDCDKQGKLCCKAVT